MRRIQVAGAVAVLTLALESLGFAQATAQETPLPTFPVAKVTLANPLGLTVDHLSISVMDIDKMAEFFRSVLGFGLVASGSWGPDVKYQTLVIPGVFRVDLVQHTGSVRHSTGGRFDMEQGLLHVCFKTADINAAYQRVMLKHATVRLTKGQDGALEEIFVIDPEGNEVEIQRY